MVEPLAGTALAHLGSGSVRSARARRGRLQGSGRAQADVGGRARPRAREPEGPGRRVPALDGRPRSGARVRSAVSRSSTRSSYRMLEHDEPGARDRGVRARHVRLGRAPALRSRSLGRAAEGRRDGRLHPQRRIAARRIPAHGAVGSAHAHAAHRGRRHDRRQHGRRRAAAPVDQAADQRPPARAARGHAQRRDPRDRGGPGAASRCSRSSISSRQDWTPPPRTGFEAAA